MHIEKWYLDCVTPDGAGMIGYVASIGAGRLAIRCSETLQWRAGDTAAVNRTVLGGELPLISPEGVEWRNRAVEIQGQWTARGTGMPATVLYEDLSGRVEWACVCPAGRVVARIGADHCEGSGYAERLILTLHPARLPIRELRWGRFIADAHSCVWIQWLGMEERSWYFHNGRCVGGQMPDLRQLVWSRHRLQLEQGIALRSGRIADTALKNAGLLRWLAPAAVRNLQETKWCCRGILTDGNGCEHAGWAIHEVAIFP
jgi:hypothetical protein